MKTELWWVLLLLRILLRKYFGEIHDEHDEEEELIASAQAKLTSETA